MCGISGAVTYRDAKRARQLVDRIVGYQQARGPDSQAVREFDAGSARVVFGHNRLAIIDPVPESDQPFMSGDGRATLVFNGAIYNYKELRQELAQLGVRFRTESDTEVLIEAYCRWGEEAFDRFFGMFAFAIHDRSTNRLYLVRDRFGVKPLYYRSDGEGLAFASTPNAIAEFSQLSPNLEYVSRGIRLKYYEDDGEIAPFSGISAVQPAHFLCFDLDSGLAVRERSYYDLSLRAAERADNMAGMGPEALRDGLKVLLESACRLRLRADVPIGISVSGGLDSSSIAAVIAEGGDKLHAFTFGLSDDRWSEGPLVRQLAADHDFSVSYIWPKGEDDLNALFDATLEAQGAPFPHTSVLAQYAVFREARAEGVKVLLGGQGGDEALMGYRKFFLFALQDILQRKQPAELATFAVNAVPLLPGIARRAAMFWAERHRYSGRRGGMDTQLVLPALTHSTSPALAGESIRQRQILDITRYSLPTLLRYEDRNSMGNSIESRLPFLDHRLLEHGVALPVAAKLKSGFGKHLLRDAMKGHLPDAIRLSRDKRGFDTQQDVWIRGGIGNLLRSRLATETSVVRQFLPTGTAIKDAFSDTRLVSDPQAFKEAVSLLWLADPYGRARSDSIRCQAEA